MILISKTQTLDYTIQDVERQLDKHDWISAYEIFFQHIEKLKGMIIEQDNNIIDLEIQKKNINGIAIRVITKNRKFKEYTMGLASLSNISVLEEPKSTFSRNIDFKFKKLKPPKQISIPGDGASSVNLSKLTIKNLLEIIRSENDQKLDSFIDEHHISIEKESIEIVNTGSNPINSSTLKVRYKINTKLRANGVGYSINRDLAKKNLNIDYKAIIEEAHNICQRRTRQIYKINPTEISVILHPEVIGRIISFQSLGFTQIDSINAKLWNENYYLYDDPIRDNGFASSLFDDEGSITQPKRLIENGLFSGGLYDLYSTNGKKGGNGFRSAWFQPLTRSYKHPISKNITNLVITGGTGKGEKLIERKGISLVIIRGHGFIGGMSNNPNFVIHSSETEIWKNGECLGPGYNYTLSGSLNKIMTYGDLSADQYQVADQAIPGAVYIGWLRCAPGIIKIGN